MRAPGEASRLVALAVAGAVLGVLPLLLRNLAAWGSPTPPGAAGALWLTAYDDLFRYGGGPGAGPGGAERLLAAGAGAALRARLEALALNLAVLGQPLLYWAVPLAVLGGWRRRGDPATRVHLAYLAGLYATMSLLFPFPGVRGGLFHSLAALVPALALWTVEGLEGVVAWGAGRRGWDPVRAQRVFGAALAGLTLLAGLVLTAQLRARWDGQRLAYREAGAWLATAVPPGARVMTVDPSLVWYATGRDAVVTPSDGPAALLAAARAYGVGYVLLQPLSPPTLAPLYDGLAAVPGLEPVARTGDLRIYRVVPGSRGPG